MEPALGIVLIFFAWYFGIGYGLPLFFKLCAWLGEFLLEALFIALRELGRAAGPCIAFMVRASGWQFRRTFLFIRILIDEWRHPSAEDAFDGAFDEEEDDGEEEEVFAINPYPGAVAHLGLEPGFTREQFNRAYKTAMRKAHPDTGGSTEAAQDVNRARDLIREAHGW